MNIYEVLLLVGIGMMLYKLERDIKGLHSIISDFQKKKTTQEENDKDHILGGAYPVFSKREIELAYEAYRESKDEHDKRHKEASEKLNDAYIEKGVQELKSAGKTESEVKEMATNLIDNIFEANFHHQRYNRLVQLNCDALSGKKTLEEAKKLDPGEMAKLRVFQDPDCKKAKKCLEDKISSIFNGK